MEEETELLKLTKKRVQNCMGPKKEQRCERKGKVGSVYTLKC